MLNEYKFNELYEMASGISSTPAQAGHGGDFISFSTVFNNYFLPSNLSEKMDVSEKEQRTYSVKEGDIFLTRTSETLDELGMSSVATKNYPHTTYSGFLKRLRPTQSDLAYHKFMAFYLRSDLFRKTMNNNAVMTLRCSLNEQIFSYLDLLLPDYDDQVKIGDLLYLIYEKVELNNRINAELEAMAKTLYDYWFVQFDFPDTNGRPYKSSGGKMVYNKPLKRKIPEGWNAGTASEIIEFNPTTSLKKNSVASYIDMNALPLTGYMTKKVQTKEFGGGVKFKNGDVAVARITPCLENGKTGLITLLEDDEVGFGSTEFIIMRGRKIPLSAFAACLARSEYFRKFAILNMTGTSGRKRIDASILETISLPIPPENMLKEFEKVCAPSIRQLTANTKQTQELTSLRDWLLPMLMNGQVRVG